MLRALSLALVLSATWIAGCGRSAELPSPSPIEHLEIEVHSAGRLTCNSFPYGCGGWLNILPPDAAVDFVVPPSSDLGWTPEPERGTPAEGAEPTLIGVIPAATVGPHLVVVTVTGSYDVASYESDGSLAVELVSRCTSPVDFPAGTISAVIVVTFDADGTTYRAPCSIELAAT
jgi:hypothetical protein